MNPELIVSTVAIRLHQTENLLEWLVEHQAKNDPHDGAYLKALEAVRTAKKAIDSGSIPGL